jgi:hypothetical protein
MYNARSVRIRRLPREAARIEQELTLRNGHPPGSPQGCGA